MRLQDFFKYDEAIYGLNDQYIDYRNGRFRINTLHVNTPDKLLVTGNTYFFIGCNSGDFEAFPVHIVDIYHDNKTLHILMINRDNIEPMQVEIDFNYLSQSKWMLFSGGTTRWH